MTALHSESITSPRLLSRIYWRTRSFALAVIALCLLSLIVGHWLGSLSPGVPTVTLREVQSMESCTQEIGVALNLNAITGVAEKNVAIRELQETCYDKGHKQAELNEYQIRRMQFFEQYYDQRVILWMVVCITVSGVVLAGLQLAASYKLSLLGRGVLADSGEMTIEHSRIVLKSSAMGVFILIISFAFFFIFVTQVFPAKEVTIPERDQAKTPVQVQSTDTTPRFNLKPLKAPTSSNPPPAAQPNPAPAPPAADPPH